MSVRRSEVVDNEHTDLGPSGHQTRQPAIGTGQGKIAEHVRRTQVERGVALADGRLGQRTGEEGLADAGGTNDRQVALGLDPLRLGRAQDDGPFKAAGTPEIEVLDTGRTAQASYFQVPVEASVLAVMELAVNEHPPEYAPV